MNQKKEKSTNLSLVSLPSVILPVYKEKGGSSFDVIRTLKRKLPRKSKIGHFGTLDPFADGILLVGLSRSLKLTDLIHHYCPKTYLAKGALGKKTTTGDLEGEVLVEKEPYLTQFQISQAVKNFEAKVYKQVPPAFSATKYKGKKLYEYARKGEFIQKDPVERMIYQAQVESFSLEEKELSVKCQVSTGTYIRTLFEDILESVDEVGYLKELTRTNIGPISLDHCLNVAQWADKLEQNDFSHSLSPLEVFSAFPKVNIIEPERLKKLANGNPIENSINNSNLEKSDYYWLVSQDQVLALAKLVENQFKIEVNYQS